MSWIAKNEQKLNALRARIQDDEEILDIKEFDFNIKVGNVKRLIELKDQIKKEYEERDAFVTEKIDIRFKIGLGNAERIRNLFLGKYEKFNFPKEIYERARKYADNKVFVIMCFTAVNKFINDEDLKKWTVKDHEYVMKENDVNKIIEKYPNLKRETRYEFNKPKEYYYFKNDSDEYHIYSKVIELIPYKTYFGDIKLRENEFLEYSEIGLQKAFLKYEKKCVIECLAEGFHNVEKMKKMVNTKLLEKQFTEIGVNIQEGISVNDIIQWRNHFKIRTGLYFVNQFDEVFARINDGNNVVVLVLKIGDNHCWLVHDEKAKKRVFDEYNQSKLKLDKTTFKIYFKTDNFEISDKEEDIDKESDKILIFTGKRNSNVYIKNLIKRTGHYVSKMNVNTEGHCISFIHPVTNRCVVFDKDAEKAKQVSEIAYEYFNKTVFKYRGKSMSELSNLIYKSMDNLALKKSRYNEDIFRKMRTSSPLTDVLENAENVDSLDIKKCYSSILKENKIDYPVYSIYDNLEKWKKGSEWIGAYVLSSCVRVFDISFGERLLSAPLVKFLYEKGFCKDEDILLHLKPSFRIPCDVFEDFVDLVFAKFGDDAKLLVNSFIGCLGKRFAMKHKSVVMCKTRESGFALVTWIEEFFKSYEVDMTERDDLYFVHVKKQERLISDHLGIYNHVIDSGVMKVLDLGLRIKGEVLGFNTDCVYYRNGENIEELLDEKPIGGVKKQEKMPFINQRSKEREFIDFSKLYVCENNKLYFGEAGSGKTYKLIQMFEENADKKQLIITPTANARQNILNRCKLAEGNCYDFDQVFRDEKPWDSKINELDILYLDEVFMMNSEMLSLFFHISRTYKNVQIIGFGDCDQLKPIGSIYRFDMKSEKYPLYQLFGQQEKIKYNSGFARFDDKTKRYLDEFKKTDVVNKHQICGFIDGVPVDKNGKVIWTVIVNNNDTKRIIDKRLSDLFIGDRKDYHLIKYEKLDRGKERQKQDLKLVEGVRIIGRDNFKRCGVDIPNGSKWEYMKYSEKEELNYLKNSEGVVIKISDKALINNMEYGYAISIWRVQGSSINEPVLIWRSMERDMIYVAMSRITKLEDLYFANDEIKSLPNVYDEKNVIMLNEKDHLKKAVSVICHGSNGKTKVDIVCVRSGVNKDVDKWFNFQSDIQKDRKNGVTFETEIIDQDIVYDSQNDLMILKTELQDEYKDKYNLYGSAGLNKFIELTTKREINDIQIYSETKYKEAKIIKRERRGKVEYRIVYYDENNKQKEKYFKTIEEAEANLSKY